MYYSFKQCQELFGFTRHDYSKFYALAKKYNVSTDCIIHHLPQYIDEIKHNNSDEPLISKKQYRKFTDNLDRATIKRLYDLYNKPIYINNKEYAIRQCLDKYNISIATFIYNFKINYNVDVISLIYKLVPNCTDTITYENVREKDVNAMKNNNTKQQKKVTYDRIKNITNSSPWTAYEEYLVLSHIVSDEEISKLIGRSKHSIRAKRIRLLAKLKNNVNA